MTTMSRSEVEAVIVAAREQGERPNLEGANLTSVNLARANLKYVNLRGANLTRANLTGADLISAKLGGADLTRANLRGANLRGANLGYTRLCEANLTNAKLKGADLTGAYLGREHLDNPNITDQQWHGTKIGSMNITPERLVAMRTAMTGTALADLDALADHRLATIRALVARNPACNERLLMQLVTDRSSPVRNAALRHPNCTDAVRVMAALQS